MEAVPTRSCTQRPAGWTGASLACVLGDGVSERRGDGSGATTWAATARSRSTATSGWATATPGPSPASTPTAASPSGEAAPRARGPSQRRYAHEHVELAYATTVHGAQGETTHTGHLMLGEHTSAASAYVAMTRGRDDNVAHLVAENLDDARQQWSRDLRPRPGRPRPRARRQARSRGPRALRPTPPTRGRTGDLRAAWTTEQDLRRRLGRCESRYDFMAADGEPPAAWAADNRAEKEELRDRAHTATNQMRALLHEPAIRSLPPGRIEQEHADWLQDRQHEQQLGSSRLGARSHPRPSGRHRPLATRAHR